jgi:hypothetical protein
MINLKEGCEEIKAKFIQQYNNITKEDLNCDGRKDLMIGRLQQKLGKSSEELFAIITKL